MMSRIQVGSGQKIRRAATISDNAAAKDTLRIVKHAIHEGLLDQVICLDTWDRNQDNKVVNRTMTISEIDEQIASFRKKKIEDIDFVLQQMNLFSQYLKKNVHAAEHGYTASMILNFISAPERRNLLEIILKELEQAKEEFIPGKYNNYRGGPETLVDRLDMMLDKYHNQEIF